MYETPTIPLADVITLCERDPTCKASVDLLVGFYTTCDKSCEKASEAKRAVEVVESCSGSVKKTRG